MALVADSLPWVLAHVESASAIVELRNREVVRGKVQSFAAVIKPERDGDGFAGNRDSLGRLGLGRALAMKPVTSAAGHCRLISQTCGDQMPWPGFVLRLHQVANRTAKVHAMTAKAIVHEHLARILLAIGKDLRIGGAMRTGVPRGVFLLVASLAVCARGEDIHLAQPDVFRPFVRDMHPRVPQLCAQAGVVALHAAHCTVRRIVRNENVRLHLVAARASLAAL